MSANDALHIAVLGGDGIGPEVMAPALEVLRKIEATTDLRFRFTDAPAGANHYRETGKSMPDSTVRLCDEADAILLGACGLPSVRYPDNTEIMPQVELRFQFDLYAGVRSARHRSDRDPGIHRRPVRVDGEGRGHRYRGARDAGHHPKDLGAIVRVFVSFGRTPQGAGPAGSSDLRRQGQCIQGLCVFPRDVR